MNSGLPKFFLVLVVAAILTLTTFSLARQASNEDEEIRGLFLKSRKNAIARAVRKKNLEIAGPKPPKVSGPSESVDVDRIALGYSLYKRDNEDNKGVRVALDAAFETKTAARFVIEPNIDCYLYAFHADSKENLKMIFPNPILKSGKNILQAHTPYVVPAPGWYTLTGDPAIETLYIVIARNPLPNIPISVNLIESCQKAGTPLWLLKHDVLDSLLAQAGESSVTKRPVGLGQVMSAEEDRSILEERIIGESRTIKGDVTLSIEDAPSMIAWSPSPKKDLLVLKTQLKHVSPNNSNP